MKKSAQRSFLLSGLCLFLFLLLTLLVMKVDVRPIGPQHSSVGLATVNGAVFEVCGSNPIWYTISEVFGVVSLLTAGGFAGLGIWQWFSRKSLKKVDINLYLLAGLYAVMMGFYLLFEVLVINYRPVLMEGSLEASYPSSHTMLVCVIMLSAIFQIKLRVKNRPLRWVLLGVCCAVMILTALGRILSGVHWYTDVLAGILLGGCLSFAYMGAVRQFCTKTRK